MCHERVESVVGRRFAVEDHDFRACEILPRQIHGQIRHAARFYFEHWSENRNYFGLFWRLADSATQTEASPALRRKPHARAFDCEIEALLRRLSTVDSAA